MNPAEYARMASLEPYHWWYIGLRDALAKTLQQKRFLLPVGAKILDAGCGTGGNMRFLQDTLGPAYLGGFDISPLAIEASTQRVPEADVYHSDIRNPDVHVEWLDLVLSCDVIYIPGLAVAFEGLVKLVSHLRSGGLFIVNLPAYNWLYSEHDVAIDTHERYTAGRVRQMLLDLDLSVELLTYRLFVLFPAIVLARLPSILRNKPNPNEAQSDVKMPPHAINVMLASILKCEHSALRCGVRFPWGSSVYAVGRKH